MVDDSWLTETLQDTKTSAVFVAKHVKNEIKESFRVHINTHDWPKKFEATLKGAFNATCLTKKGEKDWVIVRHDKQVDTC